MCMAKEQKLVYCPFNNSCKKYSEKDCSAPQSVLDVTGRTAEQLFRCKDSDGFGGFDVIVKKRRY